MQWFYNEGSKRVGPVTEAEIERMASEGKITGATMVWNERLDKWRPYGEVKPGSAANVSSPATANAQAFCSQCGRPFAGDDLIQYGELKICAACKPVFFQKLKEGAALPSIMEYAGFWIRFGAKFIDGIILYVINMVIGVALGLIGISMASAAPGTAPRIGPLFIVLFFQLAAAVAYTTFFVGKFRATPGKMAVGVVVVTAEGDRVSYGRAFGRHFAEILSSMLLLIGYIMAAFDEEKRALHDRICNTRVIKKAR